MNGTEAPELVCKTTVIELYGGPGSGKSTLAAGTFAELKRRGHSAELVAEAAKDMAWAGTPIGPFDDWVLLGEQVKRESRLYGKVDFVVTDSPLGLQGLFELFYKRGNGQPIWRACRAIRKLQDAMGVRRLQFLVPRRYCYVQAGRYESESQARELDGLARTYLGTGLRTATEPKDIILALAEHAEHSAL